MEIIKKLMFLVATFAFIPLMVSATESYVEYSEITSGGNPSNGWVGSSSETFSLFEIFMNDHSNYSFNLKGYDLDTNSNYVLELTSDFINYTKLIQAKN